MDTDEYVLGWCDHRVRPIQFQVVKFILDFVIVFFFKFGLILRQK